jgi:hypothetical protein
LRSKTPFHDSFHDSVESLNVIDQDNLMKHITSPMTSWSSARFLLIAFAMTQFGFSEPKLSAQEAKPNIELPKTDDGLPGAGPIRRYDWFKNLWTEKRG